MKRIVVNDISIFIDLYDVGLLDEFFHLPWEIHTTDFVISKLQREKQKSAVERFKDEGSLHVEEFGFEEIVEINKLKRLRDKKLNISLTDCSAWYYAKQNDCILLTEDRRLRNSATIDGIDVKGTLYVFDMLVDTGIISLESASEKLLLFIANSPRLPENEIKKRFKQWMGEQNKERRKPMEE